MGTKFRLGPMIDVFHSQRLEDQSRNRYPTRSRQAEKEKEKDKRRVTEEEMSPSKFKGGTSAKTVEEGKDAASDADSDRTLAPSKSAKALPYVDVPPLRSVLKPTTLTAPVNA